MEHWLKNVWSFQQEKFQQLCDRKWDYLEGNEKYLLRKLEISFEVCYGSGYADNDQAKKIFKCMKSVLLKLFNGKKFNQKFACTFFNVKLKSDNSEGKSCVFYLTDEKNVECCVDLSGRRYNSWNDFLKNNKFPKCFMAYPKCGRYFNENNHVEKFVDIICEDSKSCSVGTTVKNVLVNVSDYLLPAGIITLSFNPVGASITAGATALSVGSGVFSIGSRLNQLYDRYTHESLSVDSKTLLIVSDIIVITIGSAAGVGAGCKVAINKGILSEGKIVTFFAKNFRTISRVYCGVNAGLNITTAILNYNRDGDFSRADLKCLCKVIFFSFFTIVSEEQLRKLLELMMNLFSIENIISYLYQSQLVFSSVRSVYNLVSEENLEKLFEYLFPTLYRYYKRLKDSGMLEIVERSNNIIKLSMGCFSIRSLSGTDFIAGLSTLNALIKECHKLWADIVRFRKGFESENNYHQTNDWIQNQGIDINKNKNKNEFYEMITSPIEMEEKIKETIRVCFFPVKPDSFIAKKEKELLTKLDNLAKLHGTKSNAYCINKIKFYCIKFQECFQKQIETYYYNYFLYTFESKYSNKKELTREEYFQSQGILCDIFEHIYKTSLDFLSTNLRKYHEEFEEIFATSQLIDRREMIVFELQMPMSTSFDFLIKEKFYEKARKLIPKHKMLLNDQNTTFEKLETIAVIKSNQNKFTIIFYTFIKDNILQGIIIFFDNLD